MRPPLSLFLAASLLAVACADESGPPTPTEHGRWRVTAATRAGRPTNTLDAAYFEFDTAAHTLHTNLTGEDLTLGYRDDGGTIMPEGSDMLHALNVTSLTDSTLSFHTVIAGTRFAFVLVPAATVQDSAQ